MAIGAGIFALGYHFIIRPKYPSLPALSNLQQENQSLIQENTNLRRVTNESLTKLANTGREDDTLNMQNKYGFINEGLKKDERQRKYGAMPFQQNPIILERERHFGFVSPPKSNREAFGMN